VAANRLLYGRELGGRLTELLLTDDTPLTPTDPVNPPPAHPPPAPRPAAPRPRTGPPRTPSPTSSPTSPRSAATPSASAPPSTPSPGSRHPAHSKPKRSSYSTSSSTSSQSPTNPQHQIPRLHAGFVISGPKTSAKTSLRSPKTSGDLRPPRRRPAAVDARADLPPSRMQGHRFHVRARPRRPGRRRRPPSPVSTRVRAEASPGRRDASSARDRSLAPTEARCSVLAVDVPTQRHAGDVLGHLHPVRGVDVWDVLLERFECPGPRRKHASGSSARGRPDAVGCERAAR
jgi:hypothetical protein